MARRNNQSSPATEEQGAIPVATGGAPKETTRAFLQAARRNLTEGEAASPAGIRWLAHDVERLDHECDVLKGELREVRQRHDTLKDEHSDQRVELERLRGEAAISTRNELLSYVSLSAGSVLLGAAPSYFTVPGAGTMAYVMAAVAVLLVGGGVLLRKWK